MTLIIAHRGASRAERENTVAAFARAREMGADGVELDVRRTGDGVLVVHHDAVVDGGPICELGTRDLPAWIPDVAEALDTCAGMFVNLEIKNIRGEPDHDPDDRVAHELARQLTDRGGGRRWLISSFRFATVATVGALLPGSRRAHLTQALDAAVIDRAAAAGLDAIHPHVDTVGEEGVRLAHAVGLAVNVWTCNDPDRMRELIAWGVDGICTDVPDVALAVRNS